MDLSNYLAPRGKRGIWQLRVPIPRSLHGPGKPKERIKSLGTSDRALACRLALPILAEWRQSFTELRPGTLLERRPDGLRAPTAIEIEAAAVASGYELELERADADRKMTRGAGWLLEVILEQQKYELKKQSVAVATEDFRDVEPLADEIVEVLAWSIEKGSTDYLKLCDRLNQAKLAAKKVEIARNEGAVEADTDSPLIQRVREQGRITAEPGQTLLELYDQYAQWRCTAGRKRRRRPETFLHDRPAVELFAEFVGENCAVRCITQ